VKTAALRLAAGLASVWMVAVMAAGPGQGKAGTARSPLSVGAVDTRRADDLLERARRTLGDPRRLAGLKTLVIESEERSEVSGAPARKGTTVYTPNPTRCVYRFLFPSRFQRVQTEGVRQILHTINGDEFWMANVGAQPAVPPELEGLGQSLQADPALQAAARANVRAKFVGMSLAFTLRVPPALGFDVASGDQTSLDGVSVESVAIKRGGETRFKLLLDASTFRPVALVWVFDDPLVEAIQRLADYRLVGGMKFPFRLEMTLPRSRSIVAVRTVQVDARLTPADFAKK
jgi:hypothetical protein